jgi:hypothetical protein
MSTNLAFAHCPNHLKIEKACLMLDQNILYVYAENKEHNGPYQDFTSSTIESIASEGKILKFNKAARGVYKIETNGPVKNIEVGLLNNNKKIQMKIKAE